LIVKGALIVSCQARTDNPLHGPDFMAALAIAAEQGGAGGVRANGCDDIRAIRKVTRLPIIGILKRNHPSLPVYITPSLDDALAIADAGADIIALDATPRARDGARIEDLIGAVREKTNCPVFADISTVEEGVNAAKLGADCVATTLSGYTAATAARGCSEPDVALVAQLAATVTCPVVAEGRYHTPSLVKDAFRAGAYAVVVGTAITNPREITRRFVRGSCGLSP
jgi:putative N-acetylmannosamine-6-phosphate epimerase